jgi:hypothetical protein
MLGIPATQEAEAEDHKFKVSPHKIGRLCLKNKTQTEGLVAWLK